MAMPPALRPRVLPHKLRPRVCANQLRHRKASPRSESDPPPSLSESQASSTLSPAQAPIAPTSPDAQSALTDAEVPHSSRRRPKKSNFVKLGRGPRLWNARRRIKTGRRAFTPSLTLESHLDNDTWRELVTPDIVSYIERAQPSRDTHLRILRDPLKFFSYPHNVPVELRTQVYFPRGTITLLRTPHLPPKYASFYVPLSFNKLDLKDYLKSLYNVDVLHVRSTVIQSPVVRDVNGEKGTENIGRGRAHRPMSQKKMTAELVEPFIWPDEVTDFAPWEKESYWKVATGTLKEQKMTAPDANTRPPDEHRKSIAQQAKDLLDGKIQWKPTWMSLPNDVKAMQPLKRPAARVPPPRLAAPPQQQQQVAPP